MKKVLVIFGGTSSEHEVSCVSAYNVIANLDKKKYEVSALGIDKKGIFYNYTGALENILNNCWLKDSTNIKKVDKIFYELQKYDTIFPVLHGKMGEDGKIQGLFEVAKINYVGCKTLGSAIAMNKILSKEIVQSYKIPVVPYIKLNKNEFYNFDENSKEKLVFKIKDKLGLPFIVKPNEEGSSVGVEKVDNLNSKEDLELILKNCFKFDENILIEKYIDNRQEIECAAIEYKNKDIYISTPGQIISANELYDYNSKYKNDKSYDKIPAEVSEEILDKIKEYALIIFKALNLNALARIDFFVSKGNIYFNEVNSMPGFTSISMYPKMLMYDGISYSKILDILIENENKN